MKTREWQLDIVIHLQAVQNDLTEVSFSLEFRKARERTPETRDDFRTVKVALINNEWTCDGAKISKPTIIKRTAERFLDALQNALAGSNTVIVDGRRAVTVETWKAEAAHMGLIDPASEPASARSMLSKYRQQLVAAYRIGCTDELSWKVS